MDLIVSIHPDANEVSPHLGQADYRGRNYDCALGRSGITLKKREGDGASPAGRYRLLQIRYRPDRVSAPNTGIDCTALSRLDGWCDDQNHKDYNLAIQLPHTAGHEALWRDDRLYDILAITDHNSDPVVPGDGSGIFVHVAGGKNYPPTRGCIAFAAKDLVRILKAWNPAEDRIVIS